MIAPGGSVPNFVRLDRHSPLGFDCGTAEQNAFLYERAWLDQQESLSTPFLLYSNGILAAYATVLMDLLPLSRNERGSIPYRSISAMKLAQLGVDHRFQGRGMGKIAVDFAIHLALEVAERVACRYLTVDVQSGLSEWYKRLGFVPNRLRQMKRMEDAVRQQRDPNGIALSMRLNLRGY